MAARSLPHNSRGRWITVLILIAVGLKFFIESEPPHDAKPSRPPAHSCGNCRSNPAARNCALAQTRNNDGDSFMVHLPDRKEAELRLYFVDTPESAFKSYPGGATNHQRIARQAAEMGNITPEQVVEIGKAGKRFTLELLVSHPFTIHTRWDSPFNDNRYHAHVEVPFDTSVRWLDEILIERGLARITTKPADLPDGTPAAKHLANLRELQRAAQQAKKGLWSF